jgi:hypothetical protein
MKTLKLCMALLAITFASYGQSGSTAPAPDKKRIAESDEVIHSLVVLDKNVIENAKVLIHDLKTRTAIRHETARRHIDEIDRSLAASESYLAKLENASDIAIDEIGLAYFAGLHKHYQNAIAQEKAIRSELAKPKPEKSVLIMKATIIYSEAKKAESEQLELDRRAGIMEPEEPSTTDSGGPFINK